MGLSTPMEKTGNDFGVELPEDIDSDLRKYRAYSDAMQVV